MVKLVRLGLLDGAKFPPYFTYLNSVGGLCENVTSGVVVDVFYTKAGMWNITPLYQLVGAKITYVVTSFTSRPLPSARQHPIYGDCLEVKREYYQNCCVLDCVTQCSQSATHLYEQFLLVKQIGFVTLGPLRCA